MTLAIRRPRIWTHRSGHKCTQVELTQTQTNAVERTHAGVERRILLARILPKLLSYHHPVIHSSRASTTALLNSRPRFLRRRAPHDFFLAANEDLGLKAPDFFREKCTWWVFFDADDHSWCKQQPTLGPSYPISVACPVFPHVNG